MQRILLAIKGQKVFASLLVALLLFQVGLHIFGHVLWSKDHEMEKSKTNYHTRSRFGSSHHNYHK